MTILKVVEILAQSEKSWEDAAQLAVQEAAKTVRNIKSIYIQEMEATVENDRITYYRVNVKISFEYNGMVLHEYYFGNLKRDGSGNPDRDSAFYQGAEASFGRYELWRADFTGVGKMRGVGWAVCYQDPVRKRLSKHWVTLHEVGNVAGFTPILVMDVWEHAFLLDYKPSERPKYIEAFFSNIDWDAVELRLQEGAAARPIGA